MFLFETELEIFFLKLRIGIGILWSNPTYLLELFSTGLEFEEMIMNLERERERWGSLMEEIDKRKLILLFTEIEDWIRIQQGKENMKNKRIRTSNQRSIVLGTFFSTLIGNPKP